ncbi:class I SAM-dependent methyltransferase [Nonomuraea sp. NPDC050404]|uniref:class I SAM-dependent methyltransferase n=1 Tax=Nonomuraea sp. NPDC050404 TaxID=3155783 RepID=UPI00340DC540
MSVLNDQYAALRMMYGKLPVFKSRRSSLRQCNSASSLVEDHFALLLPYTLSGTVYLASSRRDDQTCWRLVTESIGTGTRGGFLVTAMSLARRHVDPVDHPRDVEPFAFVEEIVEFADLMLRRLGVAFLTRIRPGPGTLNGVSGSTLNGFPLAELKGITAPDLDTEILRAAGVRLAVNSSRPAPSYDRELDIAVRYRRRFVLHHRLLKPMLRIASRFFGETPVSEVRDEIVAHASRKGARTFLDVACGENDLCLELAIEGSLALVVGNDVAWPQVELLQTRCTDLPARCVVMFTNHDATALPFEDAIFDVSLCKNALHHVEPSEAGRLIRETVRVARRAMVVEVMNPQYESKWGRLRHQYYLRFLKDAGVKFYSRSEFFDLTDLPSRRSFYERRTVKGVYMFALFEGAGLVPSRLRYG